MNENTKIFDLVEHQNVIGRQRKRIVEDIHEDHIVTLLEMIVMHFPSSVEAQKCKTRKMDRR